MRESTAPRPDRPTPSRHSLAIRSILMEGAFLYFFMGRLQLFIRRLFYCCNTIVSFVQCQNKLRKLHLKSKGVSVLGILDEEYHKKSNDRRARIDDKLPCVAVMK